MGEGDDLHRIFNQQVSERYGAREELCVFGLELEDEFTHAVISVHIKGYGRVGL